MQSCVTTYLLFVFSCPECNSDYVTNGKRCVATRLYRHIIQIIIIMYIYHALINALSAQVIHINLNMIFYTHVEHSPTKTIYIKYYKIK